MNQTMMRIDNTKPVALHSTKPMETICNDIS